MGIPKFFRWISERYPMCSALVEENKIPVFGTVTFFGPVLTFLFCSLDNMYLDMNGIIHPCSHPNDDNPHFRITEEEIFLAIFNYIDALFAKIRPNVAPRAKMNQQRSRRFRTAKDAQDARKKALAKGEDLPKEKAFDSNCITPGTSFMARLSENLKYFIAKKISEDAAWSSITVILSGHDVPGEGEHKIMEYIRSLRASDDYRPNIRHCLYGLDADLIMLGLLSHEPHFALLREEVTFGGRNKKTLATSNPDSQNFYLMHLSIFREYLDLEFKSMDESLVGFEYSLEHIIDDFILLSFFVGNDFLPHLPGLHINEGALAEFFKIYKEKLPEMGGYINENGILNLSRLEVLLNRIGDIERDSFLAERGYTVEVPSTPQRNKSRKFRNQPKGKENISDGIFKINDRKQPIHISRKQKELYDTVRTFLMQPRGTTDSESRIFFSSHLSDMDRTFVISLCKELGLKHGVDFDPNEEVPTSLQTQKLFVSWDVNLDDESDEESNEARTRVLKRYDFAEVLEAADFDVLKEQEGKFEKELEFQSWKSDYYREKLEINSANEEELTPIVFHYIEGLQWVLLYYYRGVPSWGWFYPFHYAPKITDLRNIQRFYPIEFEKGTPFLPFYQLMGVLPSASKELIPPAFQDLMTDPGSPILEFYPLNFEQDLNGKKQDWEAVVKIPFIDEVRLVRALKARESQLTDEEISRNSLGRAQKFFKNPDPKAPTFPRASPSPKSFPDIPKCCAVQLVYDIPSDVNLRFGLLPGNVINFHPGFPTLNTIPHSATLGYHGVAVFQQETQRETMVVTLKSASSTENRSTESIALHLLNAQTVFVGWPFLNEALVVKVSDELFSYKAAGGEGAAVTYARDIQAEPLSDVNRDRFYDSVEKTEQTYSKRFGAIIGPVDVIITVRPLKGMMLTDEGAMVKDFSTSEIDVAFQTVVEGKQHEDPRYKELPPPTVANEFLIGSSVFLLGTTANYGCLADVQGYSVDGNLLNIKLLRPLNPQLELGLSKTVDIVKQADGNERYIPAFQVCKSLKISSAALSKLTSSFFVIISGTARNRHGGNEKYNFGLNMKFESKRKKVLGMTRKIGPSWEYSQSAVNLIQDYITRFPEIVSGIDASRGGDMFSDVDLFPRDSVAVRIEELKSWIKSVGVKDFEKVSLDAQALTKPIVQQIERAVDDLYNSMGSEVYLKAKKVNNVPRNFLLKPAHAPYRCGVQLFSLGDRVVNVAASGLVPLGALGTVIGFEGSKVVDVVFDFPFMSGSTLEGR
ncbi:hypothetical protein HDU84_003762 [Entophlyctis sp. JEL0112]|nr:hypothetical protein HDU84_003762 [Entophlyctis sp. JEL0112]